MTKLSAQTPGEQIRVLLKDAGYSIPAAAVAIGMNRSNLNNVILGKVALTHDVAYRVNVLVAQNDEAFDIARGLLGLQAKNQWDQTASMRAIATAIVKAGRKYGENGAKARSLH